MAAKLKALSDQVIVLTGVPSGVGLCTAQLAAQQGARVALIASSTRVLETLVGIIGASGGDAICMSADLSVREQVNAAAREAAAHFGRIDTWVNNAGASVYGRLDQLTEAESRRVFDVNFWGVVNGSMAALPYLLGGGALINVGSELADGDLPLQGMYSSSKYAVKAFTQALRSELADVDRALSITLIEPGALALVCPPCGGLPAYREQQPGAASPDPMLVAEAILRAASGAACGVHVPQPRFWPRRLGVAAMAPAASPTAKHT
jgi:NAD(P)-dependent dehydrogenase (short-subunit alcohol dehydrogenase family)